RPCHRRPSSVVRRPSSVVHRLPPRVFKCTQESTADCHCGAYRLIYASFQPIPPDGATMFNLLKTFCELPGPAGDEAPVQNYVQEQWHDRVESIQRTRVGNVIARVGGHGPRLVMVAHADEVAFVVKHISADGYLWLTTNQRDVEQRPSMRSGYFLPLGFPALI